MRNLWNDEAGFIVSAELVLIATIMVIGLIVGLATVRDQVIQELADVAQAISNVNQSYSWSAVTGHSSSVAGSLFDDTTDFCDEDADPIASASHCINLLMPATVGEGSP